MNIAARRVLTVDDSAAMRQMVAFTLESVGFKVAQAEDGAVALEMARHERFALVLLDLNMPNLDGLSLVSALRELPDYRFTPLLMLTTESSPMKKEKGSAARDRDCAAASPGNSGDLAKIVGCYSKDCCVAARLTPARPLPSLSGPF